MGWEGGEWLENKEELGSRRGRGGSHPGKDVGFYPNSNRRVCVEDREDPSVFLRISMVTKVDKKSEGVRNDERWIH